VPLWAAVLFYRTKVTIAGPVPDAACKYAIVSPERKRAPVPASCGLEP
jgi:hypothetical protein